jgi:hypothetical protein
MRASHAFDPSSCGFGTIGIEIRPRTAPTTANAKQLLATDCAERRVAPAQ